MVHRDVRLTCAGCGAAMEEQRRGRVLFWRCPACGSHALTVSTLRKIVPGKVWAAVWPDVRAATARGARRCPDCRRAMDETVPLAEAGGMRFDICDPCELLYLDPAEFGKLEKVPVEERPELPPEVRRALADAQVALINAQYDAREASLFGPAEQYAQGIFLGLLAGLLRR